MSELRRLLLPSELREKGIPYTPQHLSRLVKAGKFPRPIKAAPGSHLNAWVESEIDEWIAGRIAERDAALVDVGRHEVAA